MSKLSFASFRDNISASSAKNNDFSEKCSSLYPFPLLSNSAIIIGIAPLRPHARGGKGCGNFGVVNSDQGRPQGIGGPRRSEFGGPK